MGLGVVVVANSVLLLEKSLITLFATTVPRRQRPLSYPLLILAPGPTGLARVAVLICPSQCWEHVSLVCPRVNPNLWVGKNHQCTSLS